MPQSIIFVHGMFMGPRCWDAWVARFTAAGYRCVAPAWPVGHAEDPAELRRRHPDPAVGALTLDAVVGHFENLVRAEAEPPLLVGHSMGGLIVQLLLARGVGRAGVVIDSAPPQGVFTLSWSFLRSNWPVVSPFVSEAEPVLLSVDQFRYAFAQILPREEVARIWEDQVVPESRRVGRAALTPAAKIDFARPHAPLLLIAGEIDHIIPAALNRANFKKYRDPGSVTELKEFPGRTHFILGQSGWEEVADYTRAFLERNTKNTAA